MTKSRKVVSLAEARADRDLPLLTAQGGDPYRAARRRIIDFLLEYSLIDSLFGFEAHGKPYPFVSKSELMPGDAEPSKEHIYQNAAFIILLDGGLPRELKKHFRLRNSNRVTWRNIQRLAPNADISKYRAAHCRMDSPGAMGLLRQLISLDYALLVAGGEPRPPAGEGDESRESPSTISHMHVKVERLTDNAIKDIGKTLGYIDKRLFERGEDYVDALEAKFFEYYGFSAHASGRKSAAAMAAQLLGKHDTDFSVLVANQDDRRLTILDSGDHVTQYFLIRLEKEDIGRLEADAAGSGVADLSPYAVHTCAGGQPIMIYKVRFRRASAARHEKRKPRDRLLKNPWLEVEDGIIVAPPRLRLSSGLVDVPFIWVPES